MSDDTTRKLPRDGNATIDAERFDALVDAVQSMSARLEAVEKAVTERAYDTKPMWERALAEIAETRAELAKTKAELKAEIAETRAELKAEIAETRAELKAEIEESRREMRDGFRILTKKVDVLGKDVLTVRSEQLSLEERLDDLEAKTT